GRAERKRVRGRPRHAQAEAGPLRDAYAERHRRADPGRPRALSPCARAPRARSGYAPGPPDRSLRLAARAVGAGPARSARPGRASPRAARARRGPPEITLR